MDLDAAPYVALMLAGTGLGAAVAARVLRRRGSPGAGAFVLVEASAAWWCLWDAADVASPDLALKIWAARVWYVGAGLLPAALVLFALQFRSQRWRWGWRKLALFLVWPLLTCLAVWTNDLHHLFWSSTFLRTEGPFPMFGVTHGPLFWLALAGNYVQLLVASIVLTQTTVSQASVYRRQAALVLAGVAVPWLANAVYATGHSPLPDLDLTPLSFAAGATLLGWAVFGQGLLDLLPVAHGLAMDSMAEAVIVLDERHRIVYVNPAASALGWAHAAAGQPAGAFLPELEPLLAQAGFGQRRIDVERGLGRAHHDYEAMLSPLRSGGARPGGWVLMLRDVTDRRVIGDLQRSRRQILAAEEEVRRQIAELLHGPIQTRLLAAWHGLGEIRPAAAAAGPEIAAKLDRIRESLDHLREQDVRHASHLLHPSIIRVGLAPALDYLAGGYEEFFEIELLAGASLSSGDDLPDDVRLTAYRLVEEALANAAKHARATKVEVALTVAGQQLRLRVADDGHGFDTAQVRPGLGFRGIEGRVAEAGGRWQVNSSPGRGTQLEFSLPLRDGSSPERLLAGAVQSAG